MQLFFFQVRNRYLNNVLCVNIVKFESDCKTVELRINKYTELINKHLNKVIVLLTTSFLNQELQLFMGRYVC